MMSRVMKIYLRDKTGVFMSLLTVVIILALYAVFLGPSLMKGLEGSLGNSEDVKHLVQIWVFAGILTVMPLTVALGTLQTKIDDDVDGFTKALQVTPVSRIRIVMSYFGSALTVAFAMTLFALLIGFVYLKQQGADLLGLSTLFEIFFILLVNAISGVAMMFLITSLVHSKSAFSTISTVVGTAVGFLAGIYLPIGELPSAVQTVMKCFPFTYGAARIRELLLNETSSELFQGASAATIREVNETLGIQLFWGDTLVSPTIIVTILLLAGAACLMASVLYMKKRGND